MSSSSGYIQKSIAVSKPVSKTQYTTILNVSIYDQQTCFSIDMRGMPHLFKQRLRLVRDRIWTRYGFSSTFVGTDKIWVTDRVVADLISKDIEWYNRFGFDVKLNFRS